jgi:hypothetical protein
MPVVFAEIGPLIARDPGLRGGRPIIAGTGVRAVPFPASSFSRSNGIRRKKFFVGYCA